MSLEITIKRDLDIVLVVKPTNTSSQTKKIMGDNIVSLTFELNHIVKLKINDTAEIFGETYRINKDPQITKKDLYRYEYSLNMEALQYDLSHAQYMNYDRNNVLQEGDFSLTGSATDFITLMLKNINRISSGWTMGAVASTVDYKTLTFSKEDCLTVLGRLAKEFDTEFSVDEKKISLSKLSIQTNYKFRYGRGRGLYTITRSQPDDQTVITRLYAFGAEKNLPDGYPSSRLRLPGGYDTLIHDLTYTISTIGGRKAITFDWTPPTNIAVSDIRIEFRNVGAATWQLDSGSIITPRILYPNTKLIYTSPSTTSIRFTAPNVIFVGNTFLAYPNAGDKLQITGTSEDGIYTVVSWAPTLFGKNITVAETVSTVATNTGTIEQYREVTSSANIEVRFRSMPVNELTPIITIASADLTDPIWPAAGVALPYLEENTAMFGVREGDYINDDIYPHRTGVISAVDATDIYKFSDSGIDFDVNSYLLPGTAAKLTFVSGLLSGYTFDIQSFNFGTKEFRILKNKDEKTLDIPNSVLKPFIGDKYVLTDVSMPAVYVQAAEALLQSKAQDYLDQNSTPAYTYSIECDPKYFRRRLIKMTIGNIVWLQDTELEVDKYIRVVGVTKSLLDEYQYSLELGEVVSPGTLSSIRVATAGNSSAITNTQRALDQNKLLNGVNIGDLKIEDGTLIISNIPAGSGTPVKIDALGRLCI